MDPMYFIMNQSNLISDMRRKIIDMTSDLAKLEENQIMFKAYLAQTQASQFYYQQQYMPQQPQQPIVAPQQPAAPQQPTVAPPQQQPIVAPQQPPPVVAPQPIVAPPSIKTTADKLETLFQQASMEKATKEKVKEIAENDIKDMRERSAFSPISKLQQIASSPIQSFDPRESSPDVDHLLGKLNSPLISRPPSTTQEAPTLLQIFRKVAKIDNSYKVPRLIVNGCNMPRTVWPKNKDGREYEK